jgi:dephospho-CoA kinase
MAGLAGAGKTTAIRLLERRGVGARLYVGALVTAEVERLGLEPGPASERRVRTELRARDGMDALARVALPNIKRAAEQGAVLIDAVYCEEERSLYRQRFGADLAIVAIEAPAEVRAARLLARPERPMTVDELARRDALELGRFGLGQVLWSADRRIANEGTLDELERALERALADVC